MVLKPGGAWQSVMYRPEGCHHENRIVYVENVKPGLLVCKHRSGEDAELASFGAAANIVGKGGKPRLSMRMLFLSAAECERAVKEYGTVDGANLTLARLGKLLNRRA